MLSRFRQQNGAQGAQQGQQQQQAQWGAPPNNNNGAYPPQQLQLQPLQHPTQPGAWQQQPPQPNQQGHAAISAQQAAGMFLNGMQHHHYQDQANQWNHVPPQDPYKPQGGSDAIDPHTGRPYTERAGTVMTAKAAEAADKFRNQKRNKSLGDLLKERAAQAKKAVQSTTQAAIDARHKAELVVIGPRPSKASHDSVAAWVSYCACFACFLVPVLGFFLLMLWLVSKYSYLQPRALRYPQRWQQTNCTLIDSDVQLQWFNPLSSQEYKATYRSVFTVNYQTILPYQAPGVPDLNLTTWNYVKAFRYAAALDNGGFVGYTHWKDSRMQGAGWACPILPGIPAAVTFQDAIRLGFVQNSSNLLGIPSPLGRRRALVGNAAYDAQVQEAELRLASGGFGRAPDVWEEAAHHGGEENAAAEPHGGGGGTPVGDPPAPAVGGEPGEVTGGGAGGDGVARRRLLSATYSRSYSGSSYSRTYSTRQTTRHNSPAPSYKYNCPDSREQAQFNWNLWLAQRARGSVPCWYPIDPAFQQGTPIVLSLDQSPTDYTCNVGCRVTWTFYVFSIIILIIWGLCACQFVFAEFGASAAAARANYPAASAAQGYPAQANGYPGGYNGYPGYPGYPGDQQGGYPQQQGGYYDQQAWGQHQGPHYAGAAPAADPNQQQPPAGDAGGYGLHTDLHGAGAQQQPPPVAAGAAPGYGLHAEIGQHDAAQQQQQQKPEWRQNNLYNEPGQQQQQWGGQPPAAGNAAPAPPQWGGNVYNNPAAY